MLLTKLKVKNFLSVNGECELPLDPRVTVLLGANDHGKSNLLRALEHLNPDSPIKEDEKNWDSKGPRLDFIFQLNDLELKRFSALRQIFREREVRLLRELKDEGDQPEDNGEAPDAARAKLAVPSPPNTIAALLANRNPAARQTAQANEPAVQEKPEDELYNIQEELKIIDAVLDSTNLVLARDGVDSQLSIGKWRLDQIEEETLELLKELTPRVELFKAFSGELQDSVTADEITSAEAEFLQGIFFYAGLNPLNCEGVFTQNDETDKTLEEASLELDRELRKLWGQGVDLDLHFQLKHKGDSIELYAKDPAVKTRHARMSKRSAGVTQFFKLSMVLHARRRKNPANSYIYLFDEPGVFLHPKGQKDLLAVFEQLAGETQIVYATHSLFMLNQNFPERHRLINRNKITTAVDAKPYRANWKYAVDALGVRLTANILFSPSILLVEGDSDPLYIYELFRVLNHLGENDSDANLVGIMSYSDLPNLRFLIQTFKAESKERRILVLFDGDAQGKDYQRSVANLCKAHDVKTLALEAGWAIEDYCLHPDLFLRAVEETLRSSFEAIDTAPPADLDKQVEASWKTFDNQLMRQGKKGADQKGELAEKTGRVGDIPIEEKNEQNAGSWFKSLSNQFIPHGGSSKVALARNYVFLSRENDPANGLNPKKVPMARSLVAQISSSLKLPSMRAKRTIEN